MVIRGWDEAFLQFRVGTKATIICPPDYAYGDAGCPAENHEEASIPPNATLKFEVELLDFYPPKDALIDEKASDQEKFDWERRKAMAPLKLAKQ